VNLLFKGLFFLFLLSIVLLIYSRYIQATRIFFPLKNVEGTPTDIGLAFQDVYLKTADGEKLNAWFIPNKDSDLTILFLHGNGGNLYHRLDKIGLINKIPINIFIVDYRGYGKSTGKPSEKGLYIDAFSAYDYLTNERNIKPENIILYGESLGGAAAIELASKVIVRGVITEGAFSSGRDMGRFLYPFVPGIFISPIFDSISKIKNVTASKLFIHSTEDEIVPYRLGKKLYEAADDPKRMVDALGDHNNMYSDSANEFVELFQSFIREIQ
jgi:uncharacterized protein